MLPRPRPGAWRYLTPALQDELRRWYKPGTKIQPQALLVLWARLQRDRDLSSDPTPGRTLRLTRRLLEEADARAFDELLPCPIWRAWSVTERATRKRRQRVLTRDEPRLLKALDDNVLTLDRLRRERRRIYVPRGGTC